MSSKQISDLMTPNLLLDYKRLKMNIERMARLARENNISLRPHIKTHKCTQIGKMQIESGAKGITVSTLREAEVFAASGFSDITYAVPISKNKFERAFKLASRLSLKVLVDNPRIVKDLDKASKEAEINIDVLVKVDCGYHRCGVDPTSSTAVDIVKKIDDARYLKFQGILTHAGHSYDSRSVDEIKKIAIQEQEVMVDFTKRLRREGLPPETISIGSTPTVSLADSFHDEITEIRPGNYVFYDYEQVVLGACNINDCALTVLASVIGSYPDRAIIDAGATALSKDQGPTHKEPNCGFGKIILDYDKGILADAVIIDSISQEHGKIVYSHNTKEGLPLGSYVRIIPNHSCLTANLFQEYLVVDKNRVIDCWKIM